METPLDILSRAATLLEFRDGNVPRDLVNHINKNSSIKHDIEGPHENRDSSSKDLPTKSNKSKRCKSRQEISQQLSISDEHRSKSVPISSSTNCDPFTEVRRLLNSNSSTSSSSISPPSSPTQISSQQTSTEMPLNLTLSPRMSQTRPTVIKLSSNVSDNHQTSNGASNGNKEEVSFDPAIDEHFRRSLGKNYNECFPAPESAPKHPQTEQTVSITGSVDDHFAKSLGKTWIDLKIKNMDILADSVDDHFAKALGDTWHKLQAANTASNSAPASPESSSVPI